jgi:hypothetical protein
VITATGVIIQRNNNPKTIGLKIFPSRIPNSFHARLNGYKAFGRTMVVIRKKLVIKAAYIAKSIREFL